MTDQELIKKLQGLKEIQPRTEWVSLVKTQIQQQPAVSATPASFGWSWRSIPGMIWQQKAAFSLAVLTVIAGGLIGLSQFQGQKSGNLASLNTQVAAVPANEVAVKSSVEELKVKSRALADAIESKSADVPAAVKDVKDVAQQLTDSVKKDPELAKVIALDVNNNKTYLDVPPSNASASDSDGLKQTSDELYKEIAIQMIQDLDKATLTKEQKDSLDHVKVLFEKGEYSYALESVLLLDKAVEPSGGAQ